MNDVVVKIAAGASIGRLAAADKVTAGIRHRAIRRARLRGGSALSREIEYMLGCSFCVGLYAAVLVEVLWLVAPGRWLCRVLALRWLAGVARVQLDPNGLRDWPEGFRWPGESVDLDDMTTVEVEGEMRRLLFKRAKSMNEWAQLDMLRATATMLMERADVST